MEDVFIIFIPIRNNKITRTVAMIIWYQASSHFNCWISALPESIYLSIFAHCIAFFPTRVNKKDAPSPVKNQTPLAALLQLTYLNCRQSIVFHPMHICIYSLSVILRDSSRCLQHIEHPFRLPSLLSALNLPSDTPVESLDLCIDLCRLPKVTRIDIQDVHGHFDAGID